MSGFTKHSMTIALAGFAAGVIAMLALDPLAAQMCKWVDEDGCVHYAEQCPEDIEGERVELQKGPSEEAVREAKERARQSGLLREERETRQGAEREEAAKRAQQNTEQSTLEEVCTFSTHIVKRLELQWPVYIDAGGRYHLRGSMHDYAYQGERNWLDDEQRAMELATHKEFVNAKCQGVRLRDVPILITYAGPPSLNETITSLESLDINWLAQISRDYAQDQCDYARFLQTDIRESGITGDQVDRLP